MRALPGLPTAGVVTLGVEDVIRELGSPPRPFFHLPAVPPPGQCLALATGGGAGVILPLQVVTWPGSGKIRTRGLLGTEFEQSILTCLAYLRVHGKEIGVDAADLDRRDIHVHLPGGGVTKEGPSAGAAILAALVSALKGKGLPSDVAITGEVDAHGALLGIGGLPAKLVGAQTGKLRAVLIPIGNEAEDPLAVPVASAMEMFRYPGLIDAQPPHEAEARRRPFSHRNSRARRQQAPDNLSPQEPDTPMIQRLTRVITRGLRRHDETGRSSGWTPAGPDPGWDPTSPSDESGSMSPWPTATTGPVISTSTMTTMTTMRGSDGQGDGPLPVPADAGEFADGLAEILRRIPAGPARFIGVGSGWYPLLIALHRQILALAPDADYQCQGVDQRYGELVWDCTGAASVTPAINAAVAAATTKSVTICERCGRPGRLLDRQGWLTTLCPDCARGRGCRPATTRSEP